MSVQILCPWERARCVHWVGERRDVLNHLDVVRKIVSPGGESNPHLVPWLRTSGSVLLLHLYAFMAFNFNRYVYSVLSNRAIFPE